MAQGPEKDMLCQTKLKVEAKETMHERREKMQFILREIRGKHKNKQTFP